MYFRLLFPLRYSPQIPVSNVGLYFSIPLNFCPRVWGCIISIFFRGFPPVLWSCTGRGDRISSSAVAVFPVSVPPCSPAKFSVCMNTGYTINARSIVCSGFLCVFLFWNNCDSDRFFVLKTKNQWLINNQSIFVVFAFENEKHLRISQMVFRFDKEEKKNQFVIVRYSFRRWIATNDLYKKKRFVFRLLLDALGDCLTWPR